ncbi:YetF domain-containing protein [Effusibacillus pohliae]|uniref:YetF domain-containing protein n=1 Tax=Effusibacillus pohliae TaxID=232270 RepID=UPI000367B292|nr:YetF domain-containing protein [Effusibacillus pohliae]
MDVRKPFYLIERGKIVYSNLIEIGRTEPWIRERLQDLQVYDIRQVRYAHLDSEGTLHVHIRT